MYHKAKVSVIIPVYNNEKTLSKAIDSVINQTLHSLQIILVDDGSTDRTPVLLQQYKMSDNRIEVITHSKNMGLGAARNTGIKQATGEYIAFLDSDDYLHLNFLESLFEKAQAENLDILQAQYIKHYSDKKEIFPENIIPFAQAVSGIEYYNEGILIEPQACAKLWKKEFVKKHNLQFSIGYYEDIIFTHQAFALAQRVNNLVFPGYHYIIHSTSITGQKISDKHINDYQMALTGLQALFMNTELINRTSSFPVSFALYLSKLCQMLTAINDEEIKIKILNFIDAMVKKYGKIIRNNKRLSWNKRQLLGRNPCLYARLKYIKKSVF